VVKFTGKVKTKRCKHCKEPFVVNPKFPLQYICQPICAIAYSKLLQSKKAAKESKEATKVMKEKLKTLGQYENEAKVVFQKWVRQRDAKLPCISCGNANSNRYDGGHWWKAEIYSGLIFNEDNCHKQCSRPCNKDLNGDQANYRIGLVKRIGLERVVWLEENKDRLRNYKYSKQELIDIKETYKQKLK